MDYQEGYPPQERPYAGPLVPRPAPREYSQGLPAPRQYDHYDGGGYNHYGHDYGHHEDSTRQDWDPDYDGQYHGASYGRGGASRAYPDPDHGDGQMQSGWGQAPPPGRGGMINRAATMESSGGAPYPARGGHVGRGHPPARGGGRPGPMGRSPSSDPVANRPRDRQPISPVQNSGFGGSPFPALPGQRAKTDSEQEADILSNMLEDMDLPSGRPPPQSRGGGASRGGPYWDGGAYGPRGSSRGPVLGHFGQRRGPPEPRYGPPMDYEQGYRDAGYGSPPRDNPGHPARSATMSTNDMRQNFASPPRQTEFGPLTRTRTMPGDGMGQRDLGPPLRADGVPYHEMAAAVPPPRSSTSQGYRSPPQGLNQLSRRPPMEGYDVPRRPGPSLPDDGYDAPPRRSLDDAAASYDPYYYGAGSDAPGTRSSNPEYGIAPPPRRMFHDNQDYYAQGAAAGSFDPPHQSRPVAGRTPDLSRTKSQPDLRRPPGDVFEMAGDVPPIPPLPFKPFRPSSGGGGEGGSDEKIPVGLPARPSPRVADPDALPAHPTPMQLGLKADPPVVMKDRPPPIRNYNYGGGVGGGGGGGGGPKPPPVRNYNSGSSQVSSPAAVGSGPQQPIKTVPKVTLDELDRLRSENKGRPGDHKLALELAKKLLEAIDVLVPDMTDQKARLRTRERFATDAHKLLKKLAGVPVADAMFVMADCFGRGLFGSEPDNKEAFSLYQSAAKLGHAPAAYRTAVCCEIGNDDGGGTRKDPTKAVQWYKRAATLGDTAAMYKTGMILLKGLLGEEVSRREAVSWLKRAAERADAANPHALHELALLYESAAADDVIIRDEAYALNLFRQAADLGYKFSQFRLGCGYEYGLMGLPIDPRVSITWYSKAAAQEEHQSELALSGWYLTGSEGVLGQSDTEAYLWARKAALAGLPKAEYAMGYFTEVGIGVAANLDDAKRWYWRAAAQDFPKARERLEDLKRSGKAGPRQRERISRSKMEKQQEGDCVVM